MSGEIDAPGTRRSRAHEVVGRGHDLPDIAAGFAEGPAVQQIHCRDFGAGGRQRREFLAIAGERAYRSALSDQLARDRPAELAGGTDNEDAGGWHRAQVIDRGAADQSSRAALRKQVCQLALGLQPVGQRIARSGRPRLRDFIGAARDLLMSRRLCPGRSGLGGRRRLGAAASRPRSGRRGRGASSPGGARWLRWSFHGGFL